MNRSVFQHSALASGLLTQADIDEALASLRGPGRRSGKPVRDERLAATLVSMGRLNRWQAEQLRAGRTKFNLGPYQILDSIGQGGMGQVFKAEHTMMGRIVAVKVLPRSKSTPEAITNFQREIRAQAQLDHENLVRAYDAGHDGNVYFLVTEYVHGTDLRRLIRSRAAPLDMHAAASLMTQAARGLDHAHCRGLIHRDVKPANVLVTPEGRAKVSDLGLAGFFSEGVEADGLGGKVVGTADYLAPEQILTPDRLTPAADIYSLGCTLYYIVTGKVPFPGGAPRDKARAHCHQPPLDPRRLNPELSDDFVEIIADMMAKQPAQRIQTAKEVIERLSPWEGAGLPAAAYPLVSSAPPPIVMPPRGVAASSLGDTEPFFLVQPTDDPGYENSSSQVSLGTQPVGAASEETVPVYRESLSFAVPPVSLRRMSGSRRLLMQTAATLVGMAMAGWLLYMLAT